MNPIFIRFKSLMIFGMVLLSMAFVWVAAGMVFPTPGGVLGMKTEDSSKQAAVETPSAAQIDPTVTIVAQEEKTTSPRDTFFGDSRIERERMRGERVEILREIVNNNNSSAQMRLEAQQKLIKISDDLEKEMKIENALIAKGFVDAIVVIEPETVMVIVPSSGLRQDEIVRIADIVVKVTACKMEDVVIVPKA